jgi:hypothetical protein
MSAVPRTGYSRLMERATLTPGSPVAMYPRTVSDVSYVLCATSHWQWTRSPSLTVQVCDQFAHRSSRVRYIERTPQPLFKFQPWVIPGSSQRNGRLAVQIRFGLLPLPSRHGACGSGAEGHEQEATRTRVLALQDLPCTFDPWSGGSSH